MSNMHVATMTLREKLSPAPHDPPSYLAFFKPVLSADVMSAASCKASSSALTTSSAIFRKNSRSRLRESTTHKGIGDLVLSSTQLLNSAQALVPSVCFLRLLITINGHRADRCHGVQNAVCLNLQLMNSKNRTPGILCMFVAAGCCKQYRC